MEKKLIMSAAEISDKFADLYELVNKSILNLMKSKGVTKVNLMVDQNGRNEEDDDYDEDWVFENRVWVECYGKYSNEGGYVSEVEIGNDIFSGCVIRLTAEGECGTYPDECVSHNLEDLISLLERLETILK